MIYADYNSTAPVSLSIAQAVEQALRRDFGNPSAANSLGRSTRKTLDACRERVAELLEAQPSEVVFLSGGTESCFLGIAGMLSSADRSLPLVSSAVEHHAVLSVVAYAREALEREIRLLSVNENGELDEAEFPKDAAVWSLMYANNETGVLFPLADIVPKVKAKAFHCDATQAVGKTPISFRSLGVDLLSFSGHKFGAPKGVGALLVRDGAAWNSILPGGGQEQGRRGGTEAVAQIVGLTKALEEASAKLANGEEARLLALRQTFESEARKLISDTRVNGERASRLANTSSLCFSGVNAQHVVADLDRQGMIVGTGSACKANSLEPSHVLRAMGRSSTEALSTVRVSFGSESTEQAMEELVVALGKAVNQEREHNRKALREIFKSA